ncbi:MAG: undecaprenyl-phosphate galactose phosphotransferase WbaP [Bryobacteraceae bacterium]
MTTVTAVERMALSTPVHRRRPARMIACLVVSDAAALLVSVAAGLVLKLAGADEPQLMAYARLLPFLFVFLAVYAAVGLYSGIALEPQEELRRTTLSSGLLFLVLAATTVSLRGAHSLFTPSLFAALALSVTLVPLFRAVVRRRFGARDWWGYPAVLFGANDRTLELVREFRRKPSMGLHPVAVLDDGVTDRDRSEFERLRIPVMSGPRVVDHFSGSEHDTYAVVVMSGAPHRDLQQMVDDYAPAFSHVLVMPDLPGFSTQWSGAKNLAGQWGLEVRRQGLQPSDQRTKRALDLFLCLLFAPILAPLAAALALSVKLGSKGPVFYGHERLGREGARFRAWKFRTMVVDSDEVLRKHLERDAAARAEWHMTHKLKNDPRVTGIGAFLRKTSLDELPQLWNVVKGEMSLVGPRPIVQAEVERYGDNFALYAQVPVGITGLWQVSGRNNTTYQERVLLDAHYARNWSIWLDLCILFQTIEAVLLRRGAY